MNYVNFLPLSIHALRFYRQDERRQWTPGRLISGAHMCSSVGAGCKAPPSLSFSHTRAECYGCGLAVCTATACSKRVMWYGARRRICMSCQDDMRKDTSRS